MSDAAKDEALARTVEELTRHVIELHARCDALSAMVRMLGRQAGADGQGLDRAMEKAFATIHQAWLERAEAHSPALAARLDTRPSAAGVDADLLKHVRFRPRE